MKKYLFIFILISLLISMHIAIPSGDTFTMPMAKEFPLGTSVQGSVTMNPNEGANWWRIRVAQDGWLTVVLRSHRSNVFTELKLFAPADLESSPAKLGTCRMASIVRNTFTPARVKYQVGPGDYYVMVRRIGNAMNYSLANSFEPAPLTNDREPNDDPKGAIPMELNTSVTGHLGYYYNDKLGWDTDDWWKITVLRAGKLTATLSSATNDVSNSLELFDSADLSRHLAYGGMVKNTATPAKLECNINPGTYYLKIHRAGNASSYTLSTNFVAAE
jgi:hypothetical protein